MNNNMRLAVGAFGLLLCAYALQRRKKQRRVRRYKTTPINRTIRKQARNSYKYFLKIKARQDPEQFFEYTRMTVAVFDELLSSIEGKISKQNRADGIGAEQRLAITLQFLSQATSMQSLAWSYHVGVTTVHKIIHEVTHAIWEALAPIYLKSPTTEDEWSTISDGFDELWNFPNCIGALDGKHIAVQAPANSCSVLREKQFNVVLLAACDADYSFTMVDVGAYGSQKDGGCFRTSIFGTPLDQNLLNVPPPRTLAGTSIEMPFALVADEAFPLKSHIWRPYGGKDLPVVKQIFNYRLSRARRTIENAFGVLVARWRILKLNLTANVDNVGNIVKATMALHNYCMRKLATDEGGNAYCPPGYVDDGDEENGRWRLEEEPLPSVGRLASNNATKSLKQLRDVLADYFISPAGALSGQLERVTQGQPPQTTNGIYIKTEAVDSHM